MTPMQNIICLKWSCYYRVAVSWNILLWLSGETNEDYRRQIDLLPSLFHLQRRRRPEILATNGSAPTLRSRMEYGVRITGPGMAYEYVYDAARVDLAKDRL